MPVRFSTEAANADKLNDDVTFDGASDPMAETVGPDGTSHGKANGRPEHEQESGEVKPGKDVNAAGFFRDKDAGRPQPS